MTSASAQARDCWALAFGDSYNNDERCLLAGYDNGDLKMFDLRMNSVRWQANVGNGVCGVQFDRPDIEMNKFVVTCLESIFKVGLPSPGPFCFAIASCLSLLSAFYVRQDAMDPMLAQHHSTRRIWHMCRHVHGCRCSLP